LLQLRRRGIQPADLLEDLDLALGLGVPVLLAQLVENVLVHLPRGLVGLLHLVQDCLELVRRRLARFVRPGWRLAECDRRGYGEHARKYEKEGPAHRKDSLEAGPDSTRKYSCRKEIGQVTGLTRSAPWSRRKTGRGQISGPGARITSQSRHRPPNRSKPHVRGTVAPRWRGDHRPGRRRRQHADCSGGHPRGLVAPEPA